MKMCNENHTEQALMLSLMQLRRDRPTLTVSL